MSEQLTKGPKYYPEKGYEKTTPPIRFSQNQKVILRLYFKDMLQRIIEKGTGKYLIKGFAKESNRMIRENMNHGKKISFGGTTKKRAKVL